MMQWAGWIIAGVLGIPYLRLWASREDARAHGIEALKETENLPVTQAAKSFSRVRPGRRAAR